MYEKEWLKKKVWDFINKSKYRMCISSIQQLDEDSIKFFLSTQTKSGSKLLQSKILHQNLIPLPALLITEPCHFLFSYFPWYLSNTT